MWGGITLVEDGSTISEGNFVQRGGFCGGGWEECYILTG